MICSFLFAAITFLFAAITFLFAAFTFLFEAITFLFAAFFFQRSSFCLQHVFYLQCSLFFFAAIVFSLQRFFFSAASPLWAIVPIPMIWPSKLFNEPHLNTPELIYPRSELWKLTISQFFPRGLSQVWPFFAMSCNALSFLACSEAF